MSAVRKRRERWRNPGAHVVFGPGTYAGPGLRLDVAPGGTFTTGRAVELRSGFRAEVGPGGRVEIGDGTRFTYDCVVQCSTTIAFGPQVIVAAGTLVVDGSHRFRDPSRPVLEQGYDFRPLTIGPGALIHANCTVINDVGERAVVGAGAVVARPVPPYSVAVGVPARVVESFGPRT